MLKASRVTGRESMLTASHAPIAAGPGIPPEIPEDHIHLSYRAQSEINRGTSAYDIPCVQPIHVAATSDGCACMLLCAAV